MQTQGCKNKGNEHAIVNFNVSSFCSEAFLIRALN